jgi:hypothetical protein
VPSSGISGASVVRVELVDPPQRVTALFKQVHHRQGVRSVKDSGLSAWQIGFSTQTRNRAAPSRPSRRPCNFEPDRSVSYGDTGRCRELDHHEGDHSYPTEAEMMHDEAVVRRIAAASA